MKFNFLSKNNIGIVIALLLVILLSQGKIFNFLFDTTLGRSILILLVLILSYVNKILGIVAVLFIVVMFNQSDLAYLEGFTDASGNTATPSPKQEAKIAERQKMRQNIKANMAAKAATGPVTPTTPTPTTSDTSGVTPSLAIGNTTSTSGQEGFDLIGKENTIKRGKQSNQISVSHQSHSSDNVDAFDGSFTDNYSSF